MFHLLHEVDSAVALAVVDVSVLGEAEAVLRTDAPRTFTDVLVHKWFDQTFQFRIKF